MPLTLHTISGSPRGWRVLLGLVIKGLDFDVKYLSLSDNELKSEDFLCLNPRGRVPTLVYDNLIITDSLAALSWLDQEFPDKPPLFGANPTEHADIWSATRDTTDKLRESMKQLIAPIFFQGISTVTPGLKEAADTVLFELLWLENRLGDHKYMVANQLSAADAVSYPEIRILARAMETHSELMMALGFDHLDEKFPKWHAWARRIEAIKHFEKTLPIHW